MYTFNKFSKRLAFATAALVVMLSGCISNDIPYPKIQPNFTTFEVADQLRPAVIDSASRTVTVYLSEEADIERVHVLKWGITQGALFADSTVLNDGYLNLREPREFTMSIYQDYVWTVKAVQNIERYFTIGSQVGQAVINDTTHTVKALVPLQQPLTDVEVRSMKLAGPLATYSPSLTGEIVDFSSPVEVTVTEFGRQTVWTLTVEQTEVSVELTSVDAWTCVAWAVAQAEEGRDNGFEYRLASAEEWTVVPDDWITHEGGKFTARIIGLQPMTEYVVRATSDSDNSVERHFTTGAVVQLPNNNFTDWFMDGKVWCPWVKNEDPFWGSGNKGATTLGTSNTVPITDLLSPTGYEGVELQSRFVGISVMGKLAAGNIFAGTYVRTDGTNGVLAFGRPFVQRPTRLTAKVKYKSVAITHASSSNPNFQYMKGQPDTCIVWCALTDTDEPVEIRTKPSDRKLFNRNDAGVIAYGQFQSGNSIDDWTEISVPLEYVSFSRVPKYILVTCSASKYGDYFTGGNGSYMWVKDVQLHYDYDF